MQIAVANEKSILEGALTYANKDHIFYVLE